MILQKLPGYVRTPAGLEWRLLKRLPLVSLIGFAVIGLMWGTTQIWPPSLPPVELAGYLRRMDFVALGAILVFVTAIVTVAIGCVIVLIMKGPAYVADAYPLSDRDAPLDDDSSK